MRKWRGWFSAVLVLVIVTAGAVFFRKIAARRESRFAFIWEFTIALNVSTETSRGFSSAAGAKARILSETADRVKALKRIEARIAALEHDSNPEVERFARRTIRAINMQAEGIGLMGDALGGAPVKADWLAVQGASRRELGNMNLFRITAELLSTFSGNREIDWSSMRASLILTSTQRASLIEHISENFAEDFKSLEDISSPKIQARVSPSTWAAFRLRELLEMGKFSVELEDDSNYAILPG